MRTKTEIQDIVSAILTDMRKTAHLSKNQMAARLGIDKRTYSRYESGESSPTLAGFIAMMDMIDAPALPIIKKYLYPESYSDTASVGDLRQLLSDYMLHSASDRDIVQIFYLLDGAHGSTHEAQLQLFTAIDHMSMDVRLIIAKLALNMWELELMQGRIINPGEAMPDMELLRSALIKATQAVVAGRRHYSSSIE